MHGKVGQYLEIGLFTFSVIAYVQGTSVLEISFLFMVILAIKLVGKID